MPTFIERLKICRKSCHKTQKDVAQFLQISERAYQHYELGDREPSNETLTALAKYFNVSIDYLVGRTDNPNVNDGRIETRPEIITCPLTGMKQTVYLYILHYQGYVYTRSNGCDNAYNCPACHECCKNFLKIDPEEEINS